MRIVFFGTPEFAVPDLTALVDSKQTVVGVFTQPDKPKNRGMKLLPTPVKEYAVTHDIPVYQPKTLRDGTALEILQQLDPELILVAAYGKILPKEILGLPAKGCVNIHSSLLPKYRGAAPINWAIFNGEDYTGVTLMYMAEGLDTGDIIAWEKTDISLDEDAAQLRDRLAKLGAKLLIETLPDLEAGTVQAIPQDDALACYAPMLSKDLSPINWNGSARQIHDQVRGLIPWPSAVTALGGVRCKVWKTALSGECSGKAPGSVVQADRHGLKIACGDGEVLELLEIQPEGKKRMTASAFLAGHPIPVT